jgi:hypothetical protein
MGVLAMMVIPGSFDSSNNEFTVYGAATVIQNDANGQEIFSQTVHNRVVDTGEEFLLDNVFQDGVATADNVQIGSICISDDDTVVVEGLTAATFDTNNSFTEANCKEDTSVATSGGTAVIGPLEFTCGDTNCADGDTINQIGICQNDADDDGDFINCATEGILFAAVITSATTLAASETVDITYTFDITSASD